MAVIPAYATVIPSKVLWTASTGRASSTAAIVSRILRTITWNWKPLLGYVMYVTKHSCSYTAPFHFCHPYFGLGEGKAPAQVKTFDPHRHEDRRDITLTWKPVKGAQGYNILWGIAPDKLYSSWMVYGDECRHLMKCLSTDQEYYLLSKLSMKAVYLKFLPLKK